MQKLKGILALTRWTEIYDFTISIALIGVIASESKFNWNFLLIILANFLTICFAFMINDIEDAEEDAQDIHKAKRNPISNKSLTKKEGYFYTTIVGVIGFLIYLWYSFQNKNITVLLVGISLFVVNFLYSWRKVRLKGIPIIDVLAHMYMLSGGLFLAAYFSQKQDLSQIGLSIFLLLSIASAYGQLDNETRDYENDVRTHMKTTATVLGLKLANAIKWSILVIVIIAGFLLVAFSNFFIKPWTFAFQVILTFLILWIIVFIRYQKHHDKVTFIREAHQILVLTGNINFLLYYLNIFIF